MVVSSQFRERILVLSLSQYQESSAIVTAATSHGIDTYLAKGIYRVKSALKPLTLIGNYLEVDGKETGNDLKVIQSVSVLYDISLLYQRYEPSIFLSFLQELSIQLFRYGDSYPTKDVLTVLTLLEEGHLLSSLLLLTGTFYKILGIRIHTEECALDQNPKELVSYSLPLGGMVCKKCLENANVSPKDVMDLYVLKFAFFEVTAENIRREVPKASGRRVFVDLIENLIHYFDIDHLHSLSMIFDLL